MSERNATPGPLAAAEHHISIEIADLPAGQPRTRAACPCGWASDLVATPAHADARGQAHLAEAREHIEHGLEWTANGLVVHRLDWMSDQQWQYVSSQMQAWWATYWAAATHRGEVTR